MALGAQPLRDCLPHNRVIVGNEDPAWFDCAHAALRNKLTALSSVSEPPSVCRLAALVITLPLSTMAPGAGTGAASSESSCADGASDDSGEAFANAAVAM